MRGDNKPQGWTALDEQEFQKYVNPPGWTEADEAAFQEQFGPSGLDYAAQAGKSIVGGALQATAQVLGTGGEVARMSGIDPAMFPQTQAAELLNKGAAALGPSAAISEAPDSAAKFLATTGASAIGQAAPTLLGGLGARAAGLGVSAASKVAAGVGMAQGATAGSQEAAALGGTKAEQWGAFLVNGGLGALDAIVPASILGRLEDAAGDGLRRAALGMVVEGGQGAWTEAVQQYGSDLYAAGTFDPDREMSVGDAAAGGGIAGAFLSALTSGAHRAMRAGVKPGSAPKQEPSASFTEEPIAQPSGDSGGLDLTGAAGSFAEQTLSPDAKPAKLAITEPDTGATPLPVPPPSGDAGVAASQAQPRALQDAGGPPATTITPLAGSETLQAPEAVTERAVSRSEQAPGEPITEARDAEATPDRTETLPGEQGYLQEAIKRAAPEPTSEEDTIGLRHEDTAKYRAEHGLPEYEGRKGGLSDVERHAKALKAFKDDPLAGKRLVDELEATGKAGSDQDAALLLIEEHRNRLEVEAAQNKFKADPTPANQALVDKALADFKRTADVLDQAGSEGGARLRAQRDRIKYDYSFAAQLLKREVANGGEPLSVAERAKLKEETDAIARAAKAAEEAASAAERERRIKALETAVAELERRGTVRERVRARTRGVERARAEVREVWKEWTGRSRIARGGVVPVSGEDLVILGKLAAKTIKLGFNTFAKFTAEVAEHLDESLHKTAWNEGLKAYRAEAAEPLAKRLKAGAKLSELTKYVDRIAESFYADGVTDAEKLADAVHSVLKEADKTITREQAVEAISHYGDFKQLTQDEVLRGVRQVRGELRETAKLADLAKGLPPKKTGVEYPEPTGRQRRLAKQVREKMKALGIRTTDPATQIKSALESAKTRVRNAIDDLTTAIDTRTQIRKGERVTVSDAELVELKAKRAELEKVYADLFVGPKDDAKIRALVESIADIDKRIAAGDTSSRSKVKQGPEPRADIAALKAERAEKAKTLADMRKAADAKTSEERIADQVKRLEAYRDKLKGKLFDAGEGGSAASRGAKQGPDVERVAQLKAEIAALNETIGNIRDAQNPSMSAEDRAIQAAERRAERRLRDMQERMRSGQFEKVKAEPVERVKSAKEIETLTELELAKRIVDRGAYEARQRNRSLAKKIIDNAIAQPMREVKAGLASADVSAVGRQGWALTVQDLVLPWRTPQLARRLGRMFRAFASEKFQQRMETEIVNDPSYRDLKKAGVEFTGVNDPLTPQEEYFQSKWLESIPYAGQIIKGSERAFVTYMNLLRLEHGKRMIRDSDGSKTALQQISRTINVFTGRANVNPGKLKNLMHGASPVLWAPSLYVSRFQFVLGEPLYGGNAHTRKLVAKEYATTLGAMASLYALVNLYSRMSDDDDKPTVSWDTSSPDYAKVKIGNTRIDLTAGLGGTARLIQREGKAIKNLYFDEKAEDPLRVAEDFFEYKFAPGLTVPYELITARELATFRKKPRPQNVGEALARVSPLSFRDTYEAMVEQGVPKGVAYAVLSAFGFSIQTYEDKKR